MVNSNVPGPELSGKWPLHPAGEKGSGHSWQATGREGELLHGGTTDRTRMGLCGQGGAGSTAQGLGISKDTRRGASG